MTGVYLRDLLRIRTRIASLRARSWSERNRVVREIGLALLGLAITNSLKTLLIVIYAPLAVVLRILNFRFPYSHAMGANFGHLAVDPGTYLKAQTIGLFPAHKAVIVAPRNRISNPFLLEMWRSHFPVISHPILAMLLTPLKWSPLTKTSMFQFSFSIRSEGNELLEFGPAVDEIERRFESAVNGNPVLTVSDEIKARGNRVLQELGVTEGSWWVALHLRGDSFHGGIGSPRNADPNSYMEAIQAVIDRGGYVVRIGDSGSSPLPKIDGLIDYAHVPIKHDWMDIFILAGARFLLGTNSGPVAVARLLAVPVAAANWVPMCQGLLGYNDIRIPKLIATVSQHETLSFEHVLSSKLLRDLHTKEQFFEAGLEWQDDSAEEIKELATEMLDRLDGIGEDDALDEDLQKRFNNLVDSQITPLTLGTMSRVGRHFLRTHSDLFASNDRSSQNSLNKAHNRER